MNTESYQGWNQIRWSKKKNHVPKEIFVRPDVFEDELKRIFYGREWMPVAHVGEIPEPGDFKTFTLGRVPLIIARDRHGEVNVMYNSCSHRGNQVEVAASGNKLRFECPYHRWIFDAKGSLIGVPTQPSEFAPGFAKENFSLARPRTAISCGLVFVTFSDETPPLDEHMAGITDKVAEIIGSDGRLKLLGYQKVIFKANWKAYADNDTYHAPLLHAAFKLLNWQGGKGTRFANAKGQRGFASQLKLPENQRLLKDPSLIDYRTGDLQRGSLSVHMFPMFSVLRHLDSINIRFSTPLAVDRTEVHYAYFAREEDDEAMVTHRIRQSSNLLGPCGLVSMEDASVFQRLHIGSYTPGAAIFQKGVDDEYALPTEFSQNDEASNMMWWDHYRQVMGVGEGETA